MGLCRDTPLHLSFPTHRGLRWTNTKPLAITITFPVTIPFTFALAITDTTTNTTDVQLEVPISAGARILMV